MPKISRSAENVLSQLSEQLDFIRQSALAYDAGMFHEAKRIATAVMNIVYDRGNSVSILTQLDMKDRKFYSSGATNWSKTTGDFGISADHPLISVEMIENQPPRYIPMFDDLNGHQLSIEDWLNEIVIKDQSENRMSRLDILKNMRDTDDGSHVDRCVEEIYWNLTNNKGFNIRNTINGEEAPFIGAVLTTVRQIGHEILRSFGEPPRNRRPRPKLYQTMFTGSEILEMVLERGIRLGVIYPMDKIVADHYYYLSVLGPQNWSRNESCFCGSGRRLKHCHGRVVTKDMEQAADEAAKRYLEHSGAINS